ncbi:hypothetical protein [Nocardia yamanashiensis]|uniref:hypothetical protein n=1 Tax=Nocardia yamanashiensis TaxID=209247 RepID=UPI000A8E2245|nr:hypothetical protein [Nocardia yamanashiensis]
MPDYWQNIIGLPDAFGLDDFAFRIGERILFQIGKAIVIQLAKWAWKKTPTGRNRPDPAAHDAIQPPHGGDR